MLLTVKCYMLIYLQKHSKSKISKISSQNEAICSLISYLYFSFIQEYEKTSDAM